MQRRKGKWPARGPGTWESQHAPREDLGRGWGTKVRGQIAHSALLPAPTFRSDFWGLLTGPLLMLPRPKLLVERVEVGLPEPGQLLIIFHSIPPAGQGRAEMSIQPLDSLHSHPLPECLGLQRGCLASFTPPGGSRWNTPPTRPPSSAPPQTSSAPHPGPQW